MEPIATLVIVLNIIKSNYLEIWPVLQICIKFNFLLIIMKMLAQF